MELILTHVSFILYLGGNSNERLEKPVFYKVDG